MSKKKRPGGSTQGPDEIVVYEGLGSSLRKQGIEDEIEKLEIILNTETEFARVKRIVSTIEALKDELSALEDLQMLEDQ